MKHDGNLDLAIGVSRRSRSWKNRPWKWSELVERLSQNTVTRETHKEYMGMAKADQDAIKDIGGYVGGYLRNGRRLIRNVVHRQLLALDIDFAHMGFWDDFTMEFHHAAVLHSTHKHHPKSPRLRLVMPLSREVTPDEYVAIARRVAGDLGIELFDNTTFDIHRLMYWPSSPSDIDYLYEVQDGEWLDADAMLARYIDWRDSSLWPTATAFTDRVSETVGKQEDPETKKGVIGAFCRTYGVEAAIDTFLSEEYERFDTPEGGHRYSYRKGSTAGGLVVYDDKFAFSHHGTDPCSGKLCNAFDLVRIHKYGHLDEDPSKNGSSFRAMQEFAMDDPNVKGTIASENLSNAKYEFSEIDDLEDGDQEEGFDTEWMKELEMDTKGNYKSTAPNINLILANDPRLRGIFKENGFDGKRYVFGNLPWRKVRPPEIMRNVDYSGVRNYIESIYGIAGNLKIDDSLAIEFEKNTFHPIRDYLSSLEHDGKKRVDTLFIDYFGAVDNDYTRQAARKMMCAAVARVFRPGIKFDLVITLVGDEGTGKSTLADKLGKEWFSDTFTTVQGKEAFEQIQGAWIIEMAELSALRKAEVEAVKHFITKRVDSFRPAYARVSETYHRQCVFIATTNNMDFLKSTTGNRRFIPIDVRPEHRTKSPFDIDDDTIDQLWAEATALWRSGEKLYMEGLAERIAKREQERHSEVDQRLGLIENFLDTKLPRDWDEKKALERRMFWDDPLSAKGTVTRIYTCAAEIWCECLGRDKKDMDRYRTREINEMLKCLPGWEQVNSTRNFPLYGKQKYYQRIFDDSLM